MCLKRKRVLAGVYRSEPLGGRLRSWAIQRKWEHIWRGAPDDRSYRLVQDKIGSEFDIYKRSDQTYY
jgi:hypothetical protein